LFIATCFSLCAESGDYFSNPSIYPEEKLSKELNEKTLDMCWHFGNESHFVPFVQIVIKDFNLWAVLKKVLAIYARNAGFLYTSRDSYGFMNMNKVQASSSDTLFVRLSPGLESPEDIRK